MSLATAISNTIRRLNLQSFIMRLPVFGQALYDGISEEFNRVNDFRDIVTKSVVPNTNMATETIEDNEKARGIDTDTTKTDSERIDRIISEAQRDGNGGPDWIQDRIRKAGYDLYVLLNIFPIELIDRGDCENATPPMIFDETVPVLTSTTFERDIAEKHAGTYSYKVTKTVASGTAAYVTLCDNELTSDMHGLVAGHTYTLSAWVKVPIASGIALNEIMMRIEDYDGDWSVSYSGNLTAFDTWQRLTVTRTIRSGATGTSILFHIMSTAALNEYFYVDDIELYEDPPVYIDPETVPGQLITSSPNGNVGGVPVFGFAYPDPQPFSITADPNRWGYFFFLSPFSDRIALDAERDIITYQDFVFLKKMVMQLKHVRNWAIAQVSVIQIKITTDYLTKLTSDDLIKIVILGRS